MKCELLAPAGSIEAFRAALTEGADAVYIGGGRFGARAYADNPDDGELLQAIDQAHLLGRRLYLTVNTLLKDRELEKELYGWLLPFYRQGLDGVIVQDLGVADFLQKEFPELPLHASTQMTVTGAHGADFLKKNGFCRVVPARELSLEEIRAIYDRTGMEIECFVHGAMCYSYSGQCLMSSLSGGRSGNRGRCAGICRLPFRLYEGDRLLTGRHSQYPLNMKDMCTIDLLPELLEAGVCSLKIEGRMKKPEYTAGVVRIYRKYLDICSGGDAPGGSQTCAEEGASHRARRGQDRRGDLERKNRENPSDLAGAGRTVRKNSDGYRVSEEDRQFLWDLFNRDGFSRGYYQIWNGRDMIALRNEKLEGVRQEAAQRVTEQMRISLASPVSAMALQAETDGILTLKNGQEASLTIGFAAPEESRPGSGTAEERTDGGTALKKAIRTGDPDRLKNLTVTARGQAPAPARNRPLTEDEVRRQMMKTGGSPFRFRNLLIRMDSDIFLPLGALNGLRREAFRMLEEETAALFRREERQDSVYGSQGQASSLKEEADRAAAFERVSGAAADSAPKINGVEQAGNEGPEYRMEQDGKAEPEYRAETSGKDVPEYWAEIRTEEQFRQLMKTKRITGFYLPLHLRHLAAEAGKNGFRARLALPWILRLCHEKQTREAIEEWMRSDGRPQGEILVRNLEEAGLLYEMDLQSAAILDAGMYTMNTRAVRFFSRLGFRRNTVPHELNAKELAARDNSCSEMIVYGRVPVMLSAQCLKKTLDRCRHQYSELVLEDRKGMRFPVLCECDVCMNRILNAVPLDLLGDKDRREILERGVRSLRFLFTTESGAEARRIADTLQVEGTVTRGHFRRGVE